MGHSLGGKVAMRIACDRPDLVDRLFVLDIAPRAYPPGPEESSTPCCGVDLHQVHSRQDADDQLAAAIPDQATRWFLLTNLERTESGDYVWGAPLCTGSASTSRFGPKRSWRRRIATTGPPHFVAGGASPYVSRSDFEAARPHFPNAQLIVYCPNPGTTFTSRAATPSFVPCERPWKSG